MSRIIAVYGTLKNGFSNHSLITAGTYLGEHTITLPGRMYTLGGFPAIVLDGVDTEHVVEVYEVDDTVAERVDHLEGYPSLYTRVQVEIQDDDKSHGVWVYVMTQQNLQRFGIDEAAIINSWEH